MFTIDNTNGFDTETLEKMNAELNELISDLDNGDEDCDQLLKEAEGKIFNKYC